MPDILEIEITDGQIFSATAFETNQLEDANQYATASGGTLYTLYHDGVTYERGAHYVNRYLYVVMPRNLGEQFSASSSSDADDASDETESRNPCIRWSDPVARDSALNALARDGQTQYFETENDPQSPSAETTLVFETVYTTNNDSGDYIAGFTVEPGAALAQTIHSAAAAIANMAGATSVNLECLPGIEAWEISDGSGSGWGEEAEGEMLEALRQTLGGSEDHYSVARGNILVRVYPDGDFALRHFEHHTDDISDSVMLRFDANGQLGIADGSTVPGAMAAASQALPDALEERVVILPASAEQFEQHLEPILEFAAGRLDETGLEPYEVQGYRRANGQATVLVEPDYVHLGGWSASGNELGFEP